jgi:hypothetical protein
MINILAQAIEASRYGRGYAMRTKVSSLAGRCKCYARDSEGEIAGGCVAKRISPLGAGGWRRVVSGASLA